MTHEHGRESGRTTRAGDSGLSDDLPAMSISTRSPTRSARGPSRPTPCTSRPAPAPPGAPTRTPDRLLHRRRRALAARRSRRRHHPPGRPRLLRARRGPPARRRARAFHAAHHLSAQRRELSLPGASEARWRRVGAPRRRAARRSSRRAIAAPAFHAGRQSRRFRGSQLQAAQPGSWAPFNRPLTGSIRSRPCASRGPRRVGNTKVEHTRRRPPGRPTRIPVASRLPRHPGRPDSNRHPLLRISSRLRPAR
jgi:hypothetical protein